LKQISLFAGVGAFELAAQDFGIKTVLSNEIDKYACQVLRKQFKHEVYEGDVRNVTGSDVISRHGRIDIITAGFPCQTFSIAGKREGFKDITRGTLFFEVIRLAEDLRPSYILLENVKGLLNHEKGRTFGVILQSLSELGYDVEWMLLNSKDFGVPQNRERVFIVGHFRGERTRQIFPIRGSGSKNLKELTTGKSQGYRIYDTDGLSTSLASEAGGMGAKTGLYRIHNTQPRSPNRPSLKYSSGGSGHLTRDDGITYCLDSTAQAVEIRPCITPDRKEKRQNGRRFKEDGDPSFSLTAQDQHGVAIGSKIRRLTPVECERLQSFTNIEKCAIITVCLDHQKKNVNVVGRNRKSQKHVGNVEKGREKGIVLSVEKDLNISHQQIKKPVQEVVNIDISEREIKIYNHKKLFLNVNTAEKKNMFPLHIKTEDFVLIGVGMITILEKIIDSGKVGSQVKEQCLIHQENGRKHVKLFGKEIMQLVENVENDLITRKKLLKYITLDHLYTENIEQKLIILSCYVINAITGFIQKEIKDLNTCTFIIKSNVGWTFGQSDSQRYKEMGNTITVNVLREIYRKMV